jgi:hypothetical protein
MTVEPGCAPRYAWHMSRAEPPLSAVHRRRLREIWRSAGWPCQDLVEIELLDAGLLARERDALGRETLRVTDAGVAVLAQTLQRNRAARDLHEALVARVALDMQRAGRVVWRGLSLRAPVSVDGRSKALAPQRDQRGGFPMSGEDGANTWVMAMPDVYSIRHTTVEDYVEPAVHEIKVRRADLLSDLRNARKREAYLALASQCWYVLKAGIGEAEEVPAACGVLIAHDDRLELARPAPRREMRLAFGTWMALARASAEPPLDDDAQGLL